MDQPRARVVFLGSGEFALRILDGLASDPSVVLAAAVTTPPRPAGRRGELHPTPVAARASELGLPVLEPERLRDPAAVEAIRAHAPDLLVLADYGRIVPPVILELAPHGALNLHPSLLPRHRGATPIPAAILAGDRETGVSLMRMDAGVDTGPLVAQVRLPLDGDETAPDLEARLAAVAVQLLGSTLPGWLAGTLPAQPQPEAGATLTRPLRREDGRLDPGRSAVELERQVRAYGPWPGTFLDGPDGRLIVLAARPLVAGDGTHAPGALLGLTDGGLAVVVADGLLELLEVRPAGRRAMSGAAYRRGHGAWPAAADASPGAHPDRPR